MSETPRTRRGLMASRWSIASFAILAALLLMGALMPANAYAVTENRHFLVGNNTCGTQLKAALNTTLGTNGDCASTPDYRVTFPVGNNQVVATAYLNNGGFSAPQDVTANSLSASMTLSAAGSLVLELAEFDSSGTYIQSLASQTVLNNGTSLSANAQSLTGVSGSVAAGNTFGYRILANITTANTRITFTYATTGGNYTNSIWVNTTYGPSYNGAQVTAQGTSGTTAPQGSHTVMQYFKLQKIDNGKASPSMDTVIDKIRVDDVTAGNSDPDNDVNAVQIWLSTDTTWNDPGDTLLGEAVFNNGTATVDITNQTITTTTNYFLVVYYVYLGADSTTPNHLRSELTNRTFFIPGATGYVDPTGFPLTGNDKTITFTNKDLVEIKDLNVLTSGYVETGITNNIVMTYSLSVPITGSDGWATLDKVKIDAIGDNPQANVTDVQVWMSTNDSLLDFATDTRIDTGGPYDFSGGNTLEIDLVNQTINATKKYFFYVYDVNTSATVGDYLQAEMVNERYIEISSADVANTFTGFKTNALPIRQYPFTTFTQCYECHTFPPLDTPGVKVGVQNRNSYTGAVIGDHEYISHVLTNDENGCNMCHPVPGGDFNHQNGDVELNAVINGGYYEKGTSWSHTGQPSATMTCKNTECHGSASPQWGIGTISCMDCHNEPQKNATTGPRRSVITDMATASSHHIYNTTALADSSCEVCHLRTTHTAEGDPKVRLLNGDTGAAVLYDGTGASAAPACVSCHDADGVARLGQNALQPFFESGDFTEPTNIGWKVGVSAHDLAENLQTDKCFGCHGNSGGSDTDTMNPSKSAHSSDQPMLLRYSYSTATPQNFCYSCHGSSGGANANIQAQFGLSFNHSAGNQKCTNCHEVHQAEGGTHTPGQLISNVTKMPGPDGLQRTYEYQICFNYVSGTPTGCHSAVVNKTDNSSETYADANFVAPSGVYQQYWDTMMGQTVMSQFNTSNYAYHPIFGQGRNQPLGTENTAWTSSTSSRKASGSGLDHTFTDGWGQASLVICSDCHGNSAGYPAGPHGSSFPWMLKGPDPDVKVTTFSGTVYPNRADKTATGTPITSASKLSPRRNFCLNCHRGDVYSWGANSQTTQVAVTGEALSRFSHKGAATNDCIDIEQDTGSGGGTVFVACLNCHGGVEVAGIHGSNLGIGYDKNGASYGDEMGKRFMNGAAWIGHDGVNNGNTTGTCYTGSEGKGQYPPTSAWGPGRVMSTCGTQHQSKSITLNYTYDWQ